MVPACSRWRIASACCVTSAWDHRSNAKRMDSRSLLRKRFLMCRSKLGVSSEPGNLVVIASFSRLVGANAEVRAPGVALHTHHQRGTGMFGGGLACCCEFSLPMRDPHSR